MKTLLAILSASASLTFALAKENLGVGLPIDTLPPIAEDPAVYWAGLREALSDLHDKRDSVEGYLRTQCGLSNGNAFRVLEYFIESLTDADSFEDKDNRFQAICCIQDYPCEEAYEFLERILFDEKEPNRRTAAYVISRMSLQNTNRLARLQEITDIVPTENWERQEIYRTIAAELQYGNPSRPQQIQLVLFLLNRSVAETRLPDQADEILLREVPKWRSSPQRAANAERMLREHPDNPTLTNFFTRVLADVQFQPAFAATTNHLSSVKLPEPQKTSPAPPRESIDADPWADLLDGLPEKKRREPTEELLDIDF